MASKSKRSISIKDKFYSNHPYLSEYEKGSYDGIQGVFFNYINDLK